LCRHEPPSSSGIDDDARPQGSLFAVDQHIRAVTHDTADAARLKDNRAQLAGFVTKGPIELRSLDLKSAPSAAPIGAERSE
jgi:hypothetical protein